MGRFILSKAHDWKLEHRDQDIRGWTVVDAAGAEVGTVKELVADTDTQMVESVVLSDGKEYPARDIDLGDGVVYLEGHAVREGAEAATSTRKYENARIHRGEGKHGYTEHEDVFRRHYKDSFGTTDHDYSHYRPAYEYGYTYGTNPDYAGKDFTTVEPDLRRDYERHHGSGTWNMVSDAARHAFRHARR